MNDSIDVADLFFGPGHAFTVGQVGSNNADGFTNALQPRDLAGNRIIFSLVESPLLPVLRLGEERAIKQHNAAAVIPHESLGERESDFWHCMGDQTNATVAQWAGVFAC